MEPRRRWTTLLSSALAADSACPPGTNQRRAQSVIRDLVDDELVDVMWSLVVERAPEAELVLLALRRLRPSRVFGRALAAVCGGPEEDLAASWDLLRASVTAADLDAIERAFESAPLDRHGHLAGALVELVRDGTAMLSADELERVRAKLASSPSDSVRMVVDGALGPKFLTHGLTEFGGEAS